MVLQEKLSMNNKSISPQKLSELRAELREKGLKVALCHGVFDLLHPGHIAHLQEAKGIADILLVSITAAPYVNRGPGRPYFSDELRMQSLAALACVDYVMLVETATALEIIDIVQPDYYVKGQEYSVAEDDVTGNINKEVERVRSYGGDVYFTSGVVYSSTKLLNNHFDVLPPGVKDFSQKFASCYSLDDVRKAVEAMRDLKVLVVGDIIIDEYVFCTVQGLMSKDRAFSARYDKEECYLGGSLAIARHVANFSNHVTVCGIVGEEPYIHSRILGDLSGVMKLDLKFSPHFRTVVKRRFVERRGIRNQYEKLFSVNSLSDPDQSSSIDRTEFYKKLERTVGENDLVILADYGHGLLDQTAMDILQNKAKFLSLNCQTNSSNFGANPITKYRQAHAFTLDERELRLAFAANPSEKVEDLMVRLVEHLKSKAGWVTLGSLGSTGITGAKIFDNCPALTLTVKDTVGAGDAFFALASLCAKLEVPMEIGSFVSNLSGAIAANILGNAHPVKKADLLKFATTLLKF
jgi:rfaE bifunctional protein nucleotidyltransferase chain/domain